MSTAEIILTAILFLCSALLAVLGVRQLQCKGYCFNNAYIFASEKEREQMDKKPYYKQSGVVFLMLAAMLLVNCIHVVVKLDWLFCVSMAIMGAAIVYAVVSSVKTSKKNK